MIRHDMRHSLRMFIPLRQPGEQAGNLFPPPGDWPGEGVPAPAAVTSLTHPS